VEDAEAGQFEADIGTAEVARHIGLAKEVSRRVAVVAARDGHQIFAARDDGRIGGNGGRRRGRKGNGRAGGERDAMCH
jgi:hypothetical protein